MRRVFGRKTQTPLTRRYTLCSRSTLYLFSGEGANSHLQRSRAIVGGSHVASPAFWAAARVTIVTGVVDLLSGDPRPTCDRQCGRLAAVAAKDAAEDLQASTRTGRHGALHDDALGRRWVALAWQRPPAAKKRTVSALLLTITVVVACASSLPAT